MKKISIAIAAALTVSMSWAQTAPENWFNLSYKQDKVRGVGTEKMYKELVGSKKPDTIIVAVIDGGVDYTHEDLKDVMWRNPGEIPGNGIDDDKNGYVDDIYGWNFIGGKDGKNVHYDNLELVRQLRPLDKRFAKRDPGSIKADEKADYDRYLKLKADHDKEVKEFQGIKRQLDFFTMYFKDIKAQAKSDTLTFEAFKAYQPTPQFAKAHKVMKLTVRKAEDLSKLQKDINDGKKQIDARLNYHLNLEFDPRGIVGDNYDDQNERYYGNPDIKGPDAGHGTHVAGIIAANRFNNVGIWGVANAVKIMGIRCVPDGDERDKDVANSIRYAVDNGAKIINMSFGKSYGHNKIVVDDAVRYAELNGVLLIHAAGNDSKNNDLSDIFPNDNFAVAGGGEAGNWIEVGALSWKSGKKSAAPFTNYGQVKVDVFAPGVDIMSCEDNGGYVKHSGTSMAAPVCAGVAAVIWSYHPTLTVVQVKQIIESSSDKSLKKKKVIIPGEKKKKVKFGTLSKTGGVVDLYAAFQMAGTMAGR
jgi:subtilisin family serine protease